MSNGAVTNLDDEKEKPPYIRTLEDVKDIINHARLDERNLTPVTQSLYYPSKDNGSERLHLMELNSHLLDKIRKGEPLLFKGGLQEKAVLCSDEKTFDIKETGISNSLILIPDLKFAEQTSTSPLKSPKIGANSSKEIIPHEDSDDDDITIERVLEQKKILKIFYEYFECREIQPRYRKLNDLLVMTRYSGPENEYLIDKKLLFTYNQLLDTVQCSKKEFDKGLTKYRVFELDGFMRVLDYEYEYRVVSLMTALMSENSWSLDEIDKGETLSALDGIAPKQVVDEIFKMYAQPAEDKPGKFRYNGDLLARIVALNILKPGLKFRVEEFMSTWQDALPEGFNINKKYLRGIGIIDSDSKPPCVRSLNEDNLPTNIDDRVDLLFKIKERWTLEEMEPYLEFFATPNENVSALLTKYARNYKVDGIRLYVAKHR